MTLILTAITPDKIVQASDRRLTNAQTGSLFDDHANKCICIFCTDSHFTVSYTGVGYIGSKRTDEYIIEFLFDLKAYDMSLLAIIQELEHHMNVALRKVARKYRKTTLLLAGYRQQRPFLAHISNFEYQDTVHLEAQDAFRSFIWRGPLVRAKGKRGLIICNSGCERALSKYIFRRLKRLVRKRFFHYNEADSIARELVSCVRAASRTPIYGRYIGRNCMTAYIRPDAGHPEGGFVTHYYPDLTSSVIYMPHLISRIPGLAICVKNVQIWTGSGPPPWWKD